MKKIKPIKRVTVYKQVIENIQRMIEEDQIKIGDRFLPEMELAKLFGVGRSSVREALKVLTIAGIIESIPGKGTFLIQNLPSQAVDSKDFQRLLQRESIDEMMEIRRILEVEAAGLAAVRRTEDEMQRLHDLWYVLSNEFEKKGNWVDAGERFHYEISKIAGNSMLIKITNYIRKDLQMYRNILSNFDDDSNYKQFKQHEAIYLSISEGSSEDARNAMKVHLEFVESLLKNQL